MGGWVGRWVGGWMDVPYVIAPGGEPAAGEEVVEAWV